MAEPLRGPFALNFLSYESVANDVSARLDPHLELDERNILARQLNPVSKMEANNNEEDVKTITEIGDPQVAVDRHQGGGGTGDEDDDTDDDEAWESVSELASDEEYVTVDEDEEGEEGDIEEEDEEDDGDDVDDEDEEGDGDSMAEEEEEDEEDEEEENEMEGENEMDGAVMSSGDEGGEKCAICLSSFNDQEVGTPESCDHTFCFECIYEWSKSVTTCPVDRSVFSLILVRNTIHGEIVRQMEVKAQEAVDEDQDPTYCEVCGECDREDRLLLCDDCDAGYHCECLTPPLINVPIEEWYCPNCAPAHQDDESSEEEYMAALRRPLRRVREYARAIARTQVAERVLSRVRQARELRRIDEEEQTGTSSAAARAPRAPKPRRKVTRKRKTTKRKTTRRKTTKRKTSKRKTTKRKKRKTTSTTASGTKKRRRKTTKRKRKVRRTSAGARTAQPSVAKTIRRRIAGKLNLVKPKVGSMMPDMKHKGEQSLLFKRHEIGVASLSLTGSEHLFDPTGYDDSPVIHGPGAQSAPTPARPLSAGPSSSSGPLDLLGSILQGQNMLHMKSENITIHKDGTLSSVKKKDESSGPRKSPTKTVQRRSSSSTASTNHNSEKQSSGLDPKKHVTVQDERSSHSQGQRSLHLSGQQKSESDGCKWDSLKGKTLDEIGYEDLEPVEMDIDDDDDDDVEDRNKMFENNVTQMSERKNCSRNIDELEIHQRHISNSHSEFLRTKVAKGAQNASLSRNENFHGQECEDRSENGDESDGDVGYHGNSENQDGDGDDGYQQGGGDDDDHGNQDENTMNNNNNNNGEGEGDDGEGEEEGGDDRDGEEDEQEEEEEEEDGEGHDEEEDKAEEEEEVEEEVEGEAEEEDASELNNIQEEEEDAFAAIGDMEGRIDEADVERDEAFEGHEEGDHAGEDEVEEEPENDADPIEGEEVEEEEEISRQVVEDSNQNDMCEDVEGDGEKVGEQPEEEQIEEEEEVEEQEEEEQDGGEEQEEEEEHVEGEEEEEEEEEEVIEELEHETDARNAEEEEQDGGEEDEQREEEEEDVEAEEGEEVDDDQNPQDEDENVNVNAPEDQGGDKVKPKPVIGELECEDISDEDNVPEEDGDQVESDEEGMIIETSDGHVIEPKPKSKDSRKEKRSEPSETHETSTRVSESDVKHGASSAEEGEVKTDDESRKGKKARGKRKRKPKKRNRDKRNVVVDPRKSISLHPQIPSDLSRLSKRGEESSGRREGSREAYGDLRQVIQVKRDTPYTAEELRRYHEECWEEYNRRRDERRVERVGSAWDQYTYDQYAYYEAWRSMGGEFAAGRPWGLHVQRDRSPIYDRRKNGSEAQGFDPRLEAQRQSARKESDRGKEEGSRKSSEKKTKSESDNGRKEHTSKKDGSSRSQKDDKDKSKKEKTKSKGHVHENSARDKNGREREDGGEKDKKYHDKEKEKERDKENRDKHAHDREKDRSRHKEREKSRERERSRKDRDHRSRDRDRHRSRDHEHSRDRERSRDRHDRSRDQRHKRSRDRERSRSRDNDHSRSRHRSRSRDRERSRKRDRSSESDRVSRDRRRDRARDRSREKDIRTSRDHDKSRERERTRESVKTKKIENVKSATSAKVPARKERGKVTVDASGVRKILLGEKAKPKEPKKVVDKPVAPVAKAEKVKVKKVKKDKAGAEGKVEKKGKKTKLKGEKKVTKGKKKKAAAKRPLSFDVDELVSPAKKTKTVASAEPPKKIEDVVLKPPSPLKFDDGDDIIAEPSTTRSLSCSPDLYIDMVVPDSDLSRTVAESSKVVPRVKSPADVAVADSSHLETDMYDPFNPTASPPSGIKSPSPIVSEASPRHDNAASSSLEVFKRATTPPPEAPPNPTSTTDVSSSDMATNPPQQGMTNEDRLMLASQASQQITKILNQLATVPVAKPRISPESPVEQTMSSASIELGISPEHLRGSSLSVSSLGSEKNFKVDPILPQDNVGEVQEDDIEMSAVDLYNKNSRDRYLKKLYHQERVVEEVKLAIKPHYQRKVINKEDYKEILRKSVNQVCHSKTGEINPVKIRRLIDGYVKKVQHRNKKPSGGDKSGSAGKSSLAGKSGFKSSKSSSKATKEPASASKLIEKGRSLGLKSK